MGRDEMIMELFISVALILCCFSLGTSCREDIRVVTQAEDFALFQTLLKYGHVLEQPSI
jgi:hypothetical protein